MVKILISGDFCPQDRVKSLIELQNFEKVFSNVSKYTKDADCSIVNFEAPVVMQSSEPIKKCGPNLRCTSQAVEAIKYAGFDVVTLANNHFYDYGDIGVIDTLKYCRDFGIETVGGGRNIAEASETLYKEIDKEFIAIINCCEHEFSIATENNGGSNPLNPINQYYKIKEAKKKAKWVLVIVHGGHEHYNLPSPRMKETYRFFVDSGADAVINHHQHCFSGYETYKSKPIIYGLGNFSFDRQGKRNSIWNTGYMAELMLDDSGITFKAIPYIQGDEEAGVRTNLDKDELAHFEKSIQNLNSIISDNKRLHMMHEEFMENSKKYFLSMAEPYTNRYLRALYIRGFLPSKMSNKRCVELLNHVICESHLERLIYALKNK